MTAEDVETAAKVLAENKELLRRIDSFKGALFLEVKTEDFSEHLDGGGLMSAPFGIVQTAVCNLLQGQIEDNLRWLAQHNVKED